MTALTDDSAALEARIQAVRTALRPRTRSQPADIATRVAASATHLGLIARLIAPAIGAVALGHPPTSLLLDDLWWQDILGGPFPLSVTAGPTGPPLPGPAIEAITAAIAERSRLSDRVVWGNVGSAANSAARLLSAARARSDDPAHAATDTVLADRRIDSGVLRAGPAFRRRSCCLIYRVADDRAAVCGDCVLG